MEIKVKTILLKIDESIYDKVISFLSIIPSDNIDIIRDYPDILVIDDKEQVEIEGLLKSKDCFIMDKKETLEL